MIRSVAARLRRLIGNRRLALRFRARLPFSVSPLDVKTGDAGVGPAAALTGHTRDISATGLSLVVPAIRIGGGDLTQENRTLRVVLDLVTRLVVIYAAPVRYERRGRGAAGASYLIGARITEMSEGDRARLVEYLGGLRFPGRNTAPL